MRSMVRSGRRDRQARRFKVLQDGTSRGLQQANLEQRILKMRPTGHIRQRSSKSFEIRYSLGTDRATGKDRYATATVVGTRKDAERELRRRLRTLDTGEHVDPNRITVGKRLADWLATVRSEVAPKSYERNAVVVAGYL